MRGLFLIFFFILNLGSTYAVASENKFDSIEIERWTPSGWSASNLNDEPEQKLMNALQSLKSLKNLNAVEVDGLKLDDIGPNAFQFFSSTVTTIRLDLDPKSTSCKNSTVHTLAYVRDSYSHTMYICPSSLDSSKQIFTLTTLIHESRHLAVIGSRPSSQNSQFHPHKLCNFGFFVPLNHPQTAGGGH